MIPHEFVRRVAALTQMTVLDVAEPLLSREDQHHLTKVLRAEMDEELVLTDAAGSWAFARVVERGIERTSEVFFDEPEAVVSLYLAPLKGDRSEWVVAKACELGVSTIVPLLSERLAVKFRGEAREKALARWQRIADEASGQCRRTHRMVIAAPVTPNEVAPEVGVADVGGDSSLSGLCALAIGPEGGWGPTEWSSEHRRVGLGTTVLRADTAGLIGATLLVQHRDGWSRHDDTLHVGNDRNT